MEKKIAKWLKDGLIDESTAKKLLDDIKKEKAKTKNIRINITIYTIAAILIGIGVISFIAANDWILELLNLSYFLKIFVMFILTSSSLWGGYKIAYEDKKYPKLGNALIVLSSLLIGGTYALTAQIYNVNAHASSLMFIWLLSIIPLAYIFKNNAVNIISIILMILSTIFFYAELALDKLATWTVFIPVLCGLMLYSLGNIPIILNKYNNFSLSYKIVGTIPIFMTLLILTCSVESSYNLISVFYIAPVILLMLLNSANYIFQKKPTTLLKIETTSAIMLLCALLLILILPEISAPAVIFFAHACLIALIVFGFNYGYKFENGKIISITNWMTSIYLIVNYCRYAWSYMDKSLFFILGGSALLCLGIFLEKRKKEITRKDKQS